MFLIAQASGVSPSPILILPGLLLLLLIGFLLYRIGQRASINDSLDEEAVCRSCESVAFPKTEKPGSMLFGICLFFVFVVPGVLYAIWRITNQTEVCSFCGSEDLVPKYSPAGERIIEGQKSEA